MVLRVLSGRCFDRAWAVSMVLAEGVLGSVYSEFAERYGRVCSNWSSCLWCMTKGVGVVLAIPGRRAGLLVGMRRGMEERWVLFVVGDASESLTSRTTAVRERYWYQCRVLGRKEVPGCCEWSCDSA